MNPTRCQSCGTPIFFAVNVKTGRPMPINCGWTPTGNVELVRVPDDVPFVGLSGVYRTGTKGCVVLTKQELEQRENRVGLYRSHFSTCPQAKQWRQGETK